MVSTRQPVALRVFVIFPSITALFLTLRLMSRAIAKTFGLDDALILVSYALALADSITYYKFVQALYLGFHPYDIPFMTTQHLDYAQALTITSQISYYSCLCFTRASIAVFILRLDQLPKFVRIQLWLLFGINLCLFLSAFFADLFQCGGMIAYTYGYPIGVDLDKAEITERSVRCINRAAFFITVSITSLLLDLWLLSVPIAIVKGMNMPKKQKLMVVAILGMGLISTIIGIARLVILSGFWLATTTNTFYSTTYGFGVIELNIGIWAACTPALKALMFRIFPKFWTMTSKSHDSAGEALPDEGRFLEMGAISEHPPSVLRPQPEAEPRGKTRERLHRRPSQIEAELRRFEYDMTASKLRTSTSDIQSRPDSRTGSYRRSVSLSRSFSSMSAPPTVTSEQGPSRPTISSPAAD
ncbi:hypothetical protein LOZ35_000739 [Ophidiomyces ophidiicola]|uniref:uncharacterized protein n=1 Tax=Ophidiomyces ophidiicola TaxID=1387563 RepID=UPI0020C1DCC6|nr:uncharacterized protein LOZ57_004564 [Ophidiomyces ophidiicola]KAI1944892.1 hypothetical protein LOZ57_004564 [Ophidiomyces ophidiicola]KAI2061124.1 hypothetical protein LOZ43_001329 [Ophidiomyces ophidiicola]KAI2101059.1 hypothetical protein LOZ35_000739 [Ophidiomyces ophidiicola]KAI2122634.1 hypothetical protein LOZ32_001898 [Ophidiomyces ophidiicola]KAI2188797.1 hypothetical protein LOZ22_000383 [Ophidiomyces ophidiicola]